MILWDYFFVIIKLSKPNKLDGLRLLNHYRYVYAFSIWDCFDGCKKDHHCAAITFNVFENNGCHFYRQGEYKLKFDNGWSTIFKLFWEIDF